MQNKKVLIKITVIFALVMIAAVAAYGTVRNMLAERNDAKADEYVKKIEASGMDFTVYDLDGKEVKLSDMKGKPVVVNFWTSWCYACTKELPAFEEAYHEYKDEVVFMMVNKFDGNRENSVSLTNFLNEKRYQFPVYLDTSKDAYTNMRVYGIPMTFFIDAEGNQIAHHSGEMSKEELYHAIELLCED